MAVALELALPTLRDIDCLREGLIPYFRRTHLRAYIHVQTRAHIRTAIATDTDTAGRPCICTVRGAAFLLSDRTKCR